jgi:hypothetical protein
MAPHAALQASGQRRCARSLCGPHAGFCGNPRGDWAERCAQARVMPHYWARSVIGMILRSVLVMSTAAGRLWDRLNGQGAGNTETTSCRHL